MPRQTIFTFHKDVLNNELDKRPQRRPSTENISACVTVYHIVLRVPPTLLRGIVSLKSKKTVNTKKIED